MLGASPGLIAGGFLSHHLAQPFRRLKIIHPKDLLHPGIGDEGSRPFAVEVLELAHVLQNRPELKPMARSTASRRPRAANASSRKRAGAPTRGSKPSGALWGRLGRWRPLLLSQSVARNVIEGLRRPAGAASGCRRPFCRGAAPETPR